MVYSGVFPRVVWNELLGDDFLFTHFTESGTMVRAKAAFLAQLEYLSEQAVGRIEERETQRQLLQEGNPSVYTSSSTGRLIDPATGQAIHFAHLNEIAVGYREHWKIAAISCRDQ